MPSVNERYIEVCVCVCVCVFGCPTVRDRGIVYKATGNCSGKFCMYMVLSKFICLQGEGAELRFLRLKKPRNGGY